MSSGLYSSTQMGPERLDWAALKYAGEDTGCDEAQYESLDVEEKTPELNHREDSIEEEGAINRQSSPCRQESNE